MRLFSDYYVHSFRSCDMDQSLKARTESFEYAENYSNFEGGY